MKFNYFVGGIFFGLVLLLSFVFAAVSAPVDLVFQNNVSSLYDEGLFNLNWDSGGGDAEAAYTVFVFADGTLYGGFANNSLTGYSFSNNTEANYSFIVQAENATGDLANSSTAYMYVDATGPSVGLSGYVNGTSKGGSSLLSLNIQVSDSLSGVVGSSCLVNVGGASQSISVSSGWCNSSTISLSSASEGNNTINVYVDDLVGNWGLDNSYVVSVDATSPVAVAVCSPSSVDVNDAVTCTCSGSDSGSGVNSSLTTAGTSPSTSSTGTFEYVCSVTDNVGNVGTDTASYEVGQSSSVSAGYPRFSPASSKLEEGYEVTLAKNYKVYFDFLDEEHSLVIDEILEDRVKITIASDPTSFELAEGEVKKIDLDSDGRYDLQVLLEEFLINRGDFVLKYIDEAVGSAGEGVEAADGEENGKGEVEDTEGKSYWGWVVVLILVGLFFAWKGGVFKK